MTTKSCVATSLLYAIQNVKIIRNQKILNFTLSFYTFQPEADLPMARDF